MNNRCSSGYTPSSAGWRGLSLDGGSQQYRMGSRTYDPKTGSYTTADGFRSAPGAGAAALSADPLTRNSYTYVNGDPINLVDPTGHRQAPEIDTRCDANCQREVRRYEILYQTIRDQQQANHKGWFERHTGIHVDLGLDDLALAGKGAVNFGSGFVDSYTGIVGDVTFGHVEVPKVGPVFHGDGLEASYNVGQVTGVATQLVEGAAGVRAGVKALSKLPSAIREAGGVANFARNTVTKARTAVREVGGAIRAKIRPGVRSGAPEGTAGSGAGPWRPSTVDQGGAVAQTTNGSCVSACGEMLSEGRLSQSSLIDDFGTGGAPVPAHGIGLADMLGPEWTGTYFGSGEQALAAASRGPMGAALQAPGGIGHMVVSEPIGDAKFLIRDPWDGGGTYTVGSDWIERYVMAGVFR
jgi:RHS repeat-associated protein